MSIDLEIVYGLFIPGIIVGSALGTIAWMIGYAIKLIFDIMKRS